MKIDAVFSGGGVKAFAFLGALETLQQENFTIERVGGTSAGAILAALIAAGYTVEEMKQIFFSIDFNQFLDPPPLAGKYSPLQLISLYIHKGLNRGDKFEHWVEKKLRKKGIVTFAHMKEGYLKVVVSDLTKGRLVVIPDDLERLYNINPKKFSVATAIRMSAGFPYFFMPKQLKNNEGTWSYIVDGGLLSNFPLWLFQTKQEQALRPVLGVTLSETVEQQQPELVKNGIDMLQAIFKTMIKAHDTRYISTSQSNQIVFIPVKDIKTVDFNINDKTKEDLIELGAINTETFLKTWAY